MSTTALTPDRELTEMQEAFAVNFATNGGNGKQAAIEAGYSETSAAVLAHRMIRNPLVAKRIQEELSLVVASNVPLALQTQRELIQRSRSDMVKHLVATDMLDRAMGKAVQRQEVHQSAELTVRIDLS